MKYLVLFALFATFVARGQVITGDPSWVPTPNMSDEFNSGISYDASKWHWNPGWSKVDTFCLVNDFNHMSIQNNSYLRLSVTEQPCTCQYWDETQGQNVYVNRDWAAGNIVSKDKQLYGYFEVRFRIPPDNTPNSHHYGLSANAWIYGEANGVYSEIDLAEIDASHNHHTCNVHYDPDKINNPPNTHHTMRGDPNSNNNMFQQYDSYDADFYQDGQWHVYSCLWLPNYIRIYVDGFQINNSTLGCPGMVDMMWILGPGTSAYQFGKIPTNATSFPYNMDIDYVRTYHLEMDCNTIIDQCNYDVHNYDHKVKKSIKIGGCSPYNTVASGESIHLKANDFVEINGEFTVESGATFSIETMPCW